MGTQTQDSRSCDSCYFSLFRFRFQRDSATAVASNSGGRHDASSSSSSSSPAACPPPVGNRQEIKAGAGRALKGVDKEIKAGVDRASKESSSPVVGGGALRGEIGSNQQSRFLCRPPPAYFIRSGSGGDVVIHRISGSSMLREPIGASGKEVQGDAMDGRRKSEWGRPDSQCALGSIVLCRRPSASP